MIYAKAKQQTESIKEVVLEDEQQRSLAIDRKKYQSFWVGVRRGIVIDSKNPKLFNYASKRSAHAGKVSKILLYF